MRRASALRRAVGGMPSWRGYLSKKRSRWMSGRARPGGPLVGYGRWLTGGRGTPPQARGAKGGSRRRSDCRALEALAPDWRHCGSRVGGWRGQETELATVRGPAGSSAAVGSRTELVGRATGFANLFSGTQTVERDQTAAKGPVVMGNRNKGSRTAAGGQLEAVGGVWRVPNRGDLQIGCQASGLPGVAAARAGGRSCSVCCGRLQQCALAQTETALVSAKSQHSPGLIATAPARGPLHSS